MRLSRRSPMTRTRSALLVVLATGAVLVSACGATPTGPALTDPKAIVTAALTSTEAAKSVHLALMANGEATVALPFGGGTGTPLDLTGTTASADIDFVKPAAHATFALKAGLTVNGEVIAVDGKTYLKSTLTGPLYEESAAGAGLFDASIVGNLIDNLGDILLKPGVNLVKGDDVACGSKQCYTVSAQLSGDGVDGPSGQPPGSHRQGHRAGREGPPVPPRGSDRRPVAGGRRGTDGRRDGLEMGRAGHDLCTARRPGQTGLVTGAR